MKYTYKITYKDEFTKGETSTTYYHSPKKLTSKFLIDFFGLRNPDVSYYKIETVSSITE